MMKDVTFMMNGPKLPFAEGQDTYQAEPISKHKGVLAKLTKTQTEFLVQNLMGNFSKSNSHM
jgi:hypothetical protein